MHKERILALADLIEKQPHTTTKDDRGFNMDNWRHDCGTPSCIAGWAIAMREGDETGQKPIPFGAMGAKEFIGLDDRQADELFCPYQHSAYNWDKITPAHAAHTLRYLAETGVVDWSAYGRPSSPTEQEKGE